MTRTTLLLASLLIPTAVLAKARPISPGYDGNCQNPRWSPDGSRLAYEVNFHDRKAIEQYILVPGQGQPNAIRPISRGASAITAGFATATLDMVVHELSWSPANIGTWVYAASGPERDYELYIDKSPVVVSPGADGGPQWSPDGRWIAFTSARTGQGDVYLLDTQAVEQAPRQLTDAPTSAELYIAWSPDSKKIAYVGHNDDGDNLYLISDLANPRSTLLTTWGHTQTRPSFSPDGKQLAFYSNHRDPSRFDLYVLPLGGTPRVIAERVVMDSAGPSWTPDGEHLVYVLDDESRYDPIYTAPVADPSRARPLNTGTVGNGDLDLTTGTDGRLYLAVTAQGLEGDDKRDFKRVYVMELDALP
jgi:Tol biopolymer transport system component